MMWQADYFIFFQVFWFYAFYLLNCKLLEVWGNTVVYTNTKKASMLHCVFKHLKVAKYHLVSERAEDDKAESTDSKMAVM